MGFASPFYFHSFVSKLSLNSNFELEFVPDLSSIISQNKIKENTNFGNITLLFIFYIISLLIFKTLLPNFRFNSTSSSYYLIILIIIILFYAQTYKLHMMHFLLFW
jgi:hypothetical protein